MVKANLSSVLAWALLACGAGAAGVAAYRAYSRPSLAAVPLPDAELQRQFAELSLATPERAAQLTAQLSDGLGRLPSSEKFEAWMRGWAGNWSVETRAHEVSGPVEVRRYVLSFNHPALRAWSEIVDTVKTLSAEPGLTIDGLELDLAPEAERFTTAQIGFTARLRR